MTEDKKISELLSRGVEEIIDRQHLEERLKKGDKLRVKLGIDPTSSNIHIGRAVLLWKLRAFQDLGHKAIFIVGDFTGQIGDTSDKESERPIISEEEIKKNMKTYFEQAFRILDKDKTETHYNSEWLSRVGYKEINEMLELFSLHEFEARENVAKRLKAGKRVSLRELLYPLMQGYDSVVVKADLELGGTDQKFNLLAGRTIQGHYKQKPQDILMTKILPGTDGRKMSSSWGNTINLTDEPNDMFGKVMSIADNLMDEYLRLATNMSAEEIDSLQKEKSVNPKDNKIKLAHEIVKMYHGEDKAKKAGQEWERVFSQKEKPEQMEEIENKGTVLSTSVAAGMVSSNSEMKRLVEQNAIKINDQIVKEWEHPTKSGDIVQIGPRKFYKVK